MDRIVAALRAAGEPTRLRILALLSRGELTVSEIVHVLGQSQPRVSRHLKLLAEAGLIERLPEGSWVFYALAADDPHITRLVDAAVAALKRSEGPGGELARDLERLSGVKAARADAAAAYFRAVAQDWDRIRSLHLAESEVEAAMVRAAGPDPIGLMVDVGTGTGRVLELFGPRVERGVGIDLSHEMLTVARANLDRAGLSHCTARRADLYALPFANGVADLVTIHQVLHYLDDPALAVFEAARLLAPGGSLLIVDFAPHALEFLRDEHAHRRLGFADDEVAGWAEAANLSLEPAIALGATDDAALTVKIWLGRQATESVAPQSQQRGS